jgi:hypothetical protein
MYQDRFDISFWLNPTKITDTFDEYLRELAMPLPWLRRLVTELSLRKPKFNLGSFCLGLVVAAVALGTVCFLEYFDFFPVIIILPTLHASWFM